MSTPFGSTWTCILLINWNKKKKTKHVSGLSRAFLKHICSYPKHNVHLYDTSFCRLHLFPELVTWQRNISINRWTSRNFIGLARVPLRCADHWRSSALDTFLRTKKRDFQMRHIYIFRYSDVKIILHTLLLTLHRPR